MQRQPSIVHRAWSGLLAVPSPARSLLPQWIIHQAVTDSFRDQCLNTNWFRDLRHAHQLLATWRNQYNQHRPHSALGYRVIRDWVLRQVTLRRGGEEL